MIEDIYTLQEAFRIGLLEEYEIVDLKPLYMPYRKKLIKRYEDAYRIFSLDSVYEFLTGRIYYRGGNIFVMCELKLSNNSDWYSESRKEWCPVVCDLLSNETYKIKATTTNSEDTYKIVMGPEINVEFVGEDEVPTLRLPEHTAYIC